VTDPGANPAEILSLAEVEKRQILKALERYDGNRTQAAKALGIGRNTLLRKLKEVGIES
jgi:Nif-specific regulatory protein